MQWLIQKLLFKEDYEKVVGVLRNRINTTIINGGYEFHEEFVNFDEPTICLGSIQTVQHLLKYGLGGKHLYPCAWADMETLSCRSYYTYWGEYILQQDYVMLTLGEIKRLWPTLFQYYNTVFIRPDANNKIFAAEVVHKNKLEEWASHINRYDLVPLHTLCVVAQPQDVWEEYRVIIKDGQYLTGSRYHMYGELDCDKHVPQNVIDFANVVAAKWSPHPIYVLDIGRTTNGLSVVECGSINCAGWYMADYEKILRAIAEVAQREYNELNS